MEKKYLDYVNVMQGTDSTERFSNGNTLPLTQRPFGMISFAPQTCGGGNWWYDPHARTVEGIRLTHQPSPWIGDYGTLLMVPQADVTGDRAEEVWTGMRKGCTVLRPDYLKMGFVRSGSLLELTVTERCGSVRVQFDRERFSCISFLNLLGKGHFEMGEEKGEIYGSTDGCQNGSATAFKMHFVIWPRGEWMDWKKSRIERNDTENAVLHLALKEKNLSAEFVIGISYISREQAEANCRETEGKEFDEIRAESAREWEEYLSLIRIEGEREELRTFYSCMYRTGLFPHMAYEVGRNGEQIHYSPYTGKVHDGVRYEGHGFWDTCRTLLPLFFLIHKELYRKIVESALHDYREGGWLPRWLAPGEVGCMPSTLVDSVLAQAVVGGLLEREQAEEALNAMMHHATEQASEARFGRNGIREYLRLGYVPCEKYAESVNLTLDFAYGDYCISRAAGVLQYRKVEKEYAKRAGNYRNLFDAESGFMRARKEGGAFREPFDPDCWGDGYTEASAWQTSFSVSHDLEGLAELMGGREAFLRRLDELFAREPFYRVGGYGREIHEMTEMASADYGLCAISNQPGFLLPYLYACLGEEEKTVYWVDKICKEAFHAGIDGFPGDEDNGSMAAWYILSSIGLYPVCPGDNRWVKIPPRVQGTICGEEIG